MARGTAHLEHGRAAEALAARHLADRGLSLLVSNFRARVGELDLVMADGNVLVVDTTNFNGEMFLNGSRENLHLVERFTRDQADLVLYRATVEDPTTFTKPWTIEMTWVRSPESAIYDESACYEGNYAMTSILAGARALEREHGGRRR